MPAWISFHIATMGDKNWQDDLPIIDLISVSVL